MEKLQFFTHYLGQRVLKTKDDECPEIGNYKLTLNTSFLSLIEHNPENYYLELKHISKISEEDVKWIITNNRSLKGLVILKVEFNSFLNVKFSWEDEKIGDVFGIAYSEISLDINNMVRLFADYLRSKGYAIPYMKYSVEDLIEKKWITLEN